MVAVDIGTIIFVVFFIFMGRGLTYKIFSSHFKRKKLEIEIANNQLIQSIKFPVIAFLRDNSYWSYEDIYDICLENISRLEENELVDYLIDSDLNKFSVIKLGNRYDIEKNMGKISFEELKQLVINIDSESIIATKNFSEIFDEIE